MSDEQILESVRHGLAGAHMRRPVGDILRRARTRRRTRAVTAVAGAAVFATAAFAALPPDHSAPVLAGASPSHVALTPVSFTLAQSQDGTYKFDVVPGVPLDTAAVEKALQDIGISAVVRVGELCTGKPAESASGHRFTRITSHPDGSVSLVLDSRSAPPGTTLSLGFGLTGSGRLVAISMDLFVTGTQQGCHKFTVFPGSTSNS